MPPPGVVVPAFSNWSHGARVGTQIEIDFFYVAAHEIALGKRQQTDEPFEVSGAFLQRLVLSVEGLMQLKEVVDHIAEGIKKDVPQGEQRR